MNAMSVFVLLASITFGSIGLYLVLTPTSELIRGGGPDFEPAELDRTFPLWRRLAGGVVLVISVGVIAALAYS